MSTKTVDLGAKGTLDQVSTTCGGHEDGFRAKLIKLQRVKDADGQKGIRVTYDRVPFDKPYVHKDLFFFDITEASAAEVQEITVAELAKGHSLAFPEADKVEIFLEGKEAVVAIFREA
jgi:hypothetical protein